MPIPHRIIEATSSSPILEVGAAHEIYNLIILGSADGVNAGRRAGCATQMERQGQFLFLWLNS